MDALGKDCFSETCPVLKMQSGEAAINCRKEQQAKENVGDTCSSSLPPVDLQQVELTNDPGLTELPGGAAVQ